jgi:hypothetical protein
MYETNRGLQRENFSNKYQIDEIGAAYPLLPPLNSPQRRADSRLWADHVGQFIAQQDVRR